MTNSKDDHTHLLAETKGNGNTGYIRIAKTYSDTSHLILNQAMSKIDWKLLAIPIVFIVLRMWGTLRYFLSMSSACRSQCHINFVPKGCDHLNYNPILYFQVRWLPLQTHLRLIKYHNNVISYNYNIMMRNYCLIFLVLL